MTLIWQLSRAELVKVRTTRVAPAIIGGLLLLVIGILVLVLSSVSEDDLAGEDGVRTILPLAGSLLYVFTLALGVIGMAGEYRHGMIGHSLLAAPHRWQVVAAKVLVYFLIGLVTALVATSLSFAIAAPWMESKDAGYSFENILPREIFIGSLVAGGLFAVIGVGLGALLKDQVLALFVGIGWSLLVDSLVTSLVPDVGKFLPGAAVSAMVHDDNPDLLDWEVGMVVLLGWAALFVVVGTVLARRRDLT